MEKEVNDNIRKMLLDAKSHANIAETFPMQTKLDSAFLVAEVNKRNIENNIIEFKNIDYNNIAEKQKIEKELNSKLVFANTFLKSLEKTIEDIERIGYTEARTLEFSNAANNAHLGKAEMVDNLSSVLIYSARLGEDVSLDIKRVEDIGYKNIVLRKLELSLSHANIGDLDNMDKYAQHAYAYYSKIPDSKETEHNISVEIKNIKKIGHIIALPKLLMNATEYAHKGDIEQMESIFDLVYISAEISGINISKERIRRIERIGHKVAIPIKAYVAVQYAKNNNEFNAREETQYLLEYAKNISQDVSETIKYINKISRESRVEIKFLNQELNKYKEENKFLKINLSL